MYTYFYIHMYTYVYTERGVGGNRFGDLVEIYLARSTSSSAVKIYVDICVSI